MKKIKNFLFLILALVAVSNVAYAVDYSLGGYLNGQDVTDYNANWKMTQSGSDYVITKTFSTTNNYFVIYDSNNKKYGVSSYTDENPSTLVLNGNEKVGALGLSTSSPTTITFNPSTSQISWTTTGSGTNSGSLREPYVISVYKEGWGKEYTFTPVSGSTNYEYEVTIEIPDYTGNTSDYKFWVGYENRWSDTYSENESLNKYVPECGTGVFYAKIYVLDENGQPHGSNYKNFGIHDFRCSESSATLTLTSSVREFDIANPPTSITLTATANEKTEGNYIWYFSSDGGTTYNILGETTTNTLTLSDGKIPSEERWDFKVARKVVGNNLYKEAFCVIYTIQSCGADTKGSNIFHEDFGTLTNEDSRGAKDTYNGIVPGYTYQEAPYKVNDAFYAVVANPYYSGCGDQGDNDNKVDDACIQRIQWFRDIPDHTLYNDTETGPYGGMLLINFKEPGIAYQRELNTTEAKNIRKNSILTFSAYFASAAKERDGVEFNPIKMEMNIQFLKNGETTNTWVNVATISSEVTEREGWQRSQVAWTVTDDDGRFRVVIDNKGAGTGSGNDLLVDDIRLDLCSPSFPLDFELNKDGNKSYVTEIVVDSLNQKNKFLLKIDDWGALGNNPCIQLYKVITDGENKSYVAYGNPLKRGDDNYYGGELSGLDAFKDGDEIELIAVASPENECETYMKDIEDGKIEPDSKNPYAIFSGNTIIYKKPACVEAKPELSGGDGTDVPLDPNNPSSEKIYTICYNKNMKLPMLSLAYKPISPQAYYNLIIIEEGKTEEYKVLSDKKFDRTREKQEVDLNTLNNLDATPFKFVLDNNQNSKKYIFKFEYFDKYTDDSGNIVTGCDFPQNTPAGQVSGGNIAKIELLLNLCEELELKQEIVSGSKICRNDETKLKLTLTNYSESLASDIKVKVIYDKDSLNIVEALPDGSDAFSIDDDIWSVGSLESGVEKASVIELTLTPVNKKKNSNEVQLDVKSFVLTFNGKEESTFETITDVKLKKESKVTILASSLAPRHIRTDLTDPDGKPLDDEHYAYNMCKTVGSDKDKADDKHLFNSLIKSNKEKLVWLDMQDNEIPAEDAFFYADEVQDNSVRVYNVNPEVGCPSDTITIYYRVKEITEPIKVKDYNKCAVELQEGETASLIPLADLVENADNYKYLIFTDSVNVNVINFNASKPGSATYNIVASQDELQSADNNYCEAKATVSTNIKDNAKKTNIVAKGAEVCPGTLVELTANEEFAENQNGVIIRWYSDASLEKESLLHTGETYTIEKAIEDATLYVTVETDKYCENIPAEARPVNVTLKAASPQISLEPKEQVIAIGGVAELKVSPAEVSTAPQLQLYANDVLQGEGPVRPYIDTEYKMIYNGECGVTSAKANVTVQWPTVFTPYVKDGRNDTFVTDMNPNFYTQIFTRFGTKIYESENGWDGSINGSMNGSSEIAAPGVYYYVVDLPDGNVKKGTIEVFKY